MNIGSLFFLPTRAREQSLPPESNVVDGTKATVSSITNNTKGGGGGAVRKEIDNTITRDHYVEEGMQLAFSRREVRGFVPKVLSVCFPLQLHLLCMWMCVVCLFGWL